MNNSLKQLSDLKYQECKQNFPGVPDYAVPRTKYDDKTANGLTKCIIDFIRLSGNHAERIANMGRQIGTGKNRKWIPGTGTNGTADIHAIKSGRTVCIEIKIGADRQSDKQRQYQSKVEASGGVYVIARTYEDFINKWEKIK